MARVRLAFVLALAILVAGCGSPPPKDDGAGDGEPADTPSAVEAGRGSFQLGLPQAGPIDAGAFLGINVPEGLTHLVVQLTVTVGASVGLRTSGVPGCEHQYPDPQAPGDALVYECDTQPGDHTLRFSHGGGRVHIDVVATAEPPRA